MRYFAVIGELTGGSYIVRLYDVKQHAEAAMKLLHTLDKIYIGMDNESARAGEGIEDVEPEDRNQMYNHVMDDIQLYHMQDVVVQMFDEEQGIGNIQIVMVEAP